MAVQLLACPLCSQPGFTTLDSLRDGLISAASRRLICPVCQDVLSGLDKFTIHLFSHCSNLSLSGVTGQPTRPVCAAGPLVSQPQPDPKPSERSADHRSGLPTVPEVSTARSNESVAVDVPLVSNELQGPGFEPQAVEEAPEEETRCDRCGMTFEDPAVLPLHKQLVHPPPSTPPTSEGAGGRGYSCFLCPKVFKMRGSLMVHLRVAHGASNVGGGRKSSGGGPGVGERSVVCSACGKTFTKEQHLNQHMKTHEEKQWACDVCQKMFTTKYFLKKHKRLHTGEMPYSCSICHKAFTFQQSMHKHALYHSNDKPHSCPDCHRTFKELSTLANHRRIHTGEKPFSCETCGKCFRQRVSYLVHRRIHTGVMPYQCTACGKSFRYKVSERSHKCPSQPPGVVVRQAGELLQKLQERAARGGGSALPTQQGATQVVDDPTPSRSILVPPTEAQLGTNASQFVIVVDTGNIPVPPVVADLSTQTGRDGWCREPEWFADGSKRSPEPTPDFFAVLDDLPSPSERLRNLTISPTLGAEGGASEEGGDRALRTINEESLKQLLLGFRD